MPTAPVMRRMLRLQPEQTKAKFSCNTILEFANRSRNLLDWVELMHDFNYTMQDLAWGRKSVREFSVLFSPFDTHMCDRLSSPIGTCTCCGDPGRIMLAVPRQKIA